MGNIAVAFLAPEFLPNWGGGGTYSIELIKELSKYEDLDIHVLTVEREMEDAEAASAEMAAEFSIEALNDPGSPLSSRVFYFEYDSSDLKYEDKEIIAKHAQFISLHPEISVVVEGHADERGTREYNLALETTEDYDYGARLAVVARSFRGINEPLYYYRSFMSGVSGKWEAR